MLVFVEINDNSIFTPPSGEVFKVYLVKKKKNEKGVCGKST
jgi:hypothetical protein